ncbi:MAG: hypothetical protein WCL11_25750 [Verrucomicrobiota bacterium]
MSGKQAAALFLSHQASEADKRAADAIEDQIQKLDQETDHYRPQLLDAQRKACCRSDASPAFACPPHLTWQTTPPKPWRH